MARMYQLRGSCPTCGMDVTRTVSLLHGVQAEVFHCPRDGRLASTVERMSVHDWVMSRSIERIDEHPLLA